MVVEADGVFYHDVISITQSAPNEAILVMPDRSVTVSVYSPIRVIGSIGSPLVPPEADSTAITNDDTINVKEKRDDSKMPAKKEGSETNNRPVKTSKKKK